MLVVEVGTTCWCQILGPDELLQLLVTMGVNKNWWAREADAAWCCQPIYIQHLVYRNIVVFVGYTRSGCCSFFQLSPPLPSSHCHHCHMQVPPYQRFSSSLYPINATKGDVVSQHWTGHYTRDSILVAISAHNMQCTCSHKASLV